MALSWLAVFVARGLCAYKCMNLLENGRFYSRWLRQKYAEKNEEFSSGATDRMISNRYRIVRKP